MLSDMVKLNVPLMALLSITRVASAVFIKLDLMWNP